MFCRCNENTSYRWKELLYKVFCEEYVVYSQQQSIKERILKYNVNIIFNIIMFPLRVNSN